MTYKAICGALTITLGLAGAVVGYVVLRQRSALDPAAIHKIQDRSLPTSAHDETAGWRMYRNETYGIEFRYPQDYRFETQLESEVFPSQQPQFSLEFVPLSEPSYKDALQINVYNNVDYVLPAFGVKSLLYYRKTNQWLLDGNPVCPTIKFIGSQKVTAYEFLVGDAGFSVVKLIIILPETLIDIARMEGPTGDVSDPNIPKIVDTFTLTSARSVITAQCEDWYKKVSSS